ncbi:TlpA family protein disulfide reductase [Flavobacterium phycosphaerae]|uniref:TlpA family protein disulfide reductase n=1 Tax=Flavobacterium phycosphaerae TaxID=2697515 RepID=UPI0013894686|nr:redoxin domain-containing protein [Flavobacterium phycosphaerae]
MKIIIKLTILLISLNLFSQENKPKIDYINQESIIKVRLNGRADLKITDWINNVPEDKKLDDKFIVVNFWKSGFNSGSFSIEHMNDLQAKFTNKNLYFITLTNEKPDLIKKALKNYHLKFNSMIASDQRKLNSFWTGGINTLSLPIAILIDNKGIVKWIGMPQNLDEKIINDFVNNRLEPYDVYSKIRK